MRLHFCVRMQVLHPYSTRFVPDVRQDLIYIHQIVQSIADVVMSMWMNRSNWTYNALLDTFARSLQVFDAAENARRIIERTLAEETHEHQMGGLFHTLHEDDATANMQMLKLRMQGQRTQCIYYIEALFRENLAATSQPKRSSCPLDDMSIFFSQANREPHLTAVKLATVQGTTLQAESNRVHTLTSAYPYFASPPRLGCPRSHVNEALNVNREMEMADVNQEMEMAEQEGAACAPAPGKGRGWHRKTPRCYKQVKKKPRAPKGRPRGQPRKQAGTDADHHPKSCFSDLKVGSSNRAFIGSLPAYFSAPSSQEMLKGRDVQSSVSTTWEHDQDY